MFQCFKEHYNNVASSISPDYTVALSTRSMFQTTLYLCCVIYFLLITMLHHPTINVSNNTITMLRCLFFSDYTVASWPMLQCCTTNCCISTDVVVLHDQLFQCFSDSCWLLFQPVYHRHQCCSFARPIVSMFQ